MAIAFMYLAGRVPSMLGHHGTFDAWLHTLYFGMSLPGSMVRSGRALGLLAGGAPPEGRREPLPLLLQQMPRPAPPQARSTRRRRQPPPPPRAGPTPRSQGP